MEHLEMSELRQPINPEGGSLIMQMLAQTVQGKMQSYHKRHGEAQLLTVGVSLVHGKQKLQEKTGFGPAEGMSRSLVPEGRHKHKQFGN